MILFKTIRWKNILSTGNIFTEISLDKYKNTLIVGENGSGKSTMLDALCFALFGKPFRKINKPNLLNSINQKDAVVELEFDIGKKQYKIVRGLKPNIFEIYCDSVLFNQDAKSLDYQEFLEKNILKINFKSFTQIVILGSASFVPFMQLSAADRRLIIEDLLDIQIFSAMNSLAKARLAEIKESIQKNKYELDLLENKISMQKKHIDVLKQNNKEKISIYSKDIDSDRKTIEELSEKNKTLKQDLQELEIFSGKKIELNEKMKKILALEGKIENNKQKHKKNIEFFEKNETCPTCTQKIDDTFKDEQVKQLNVKYNETVSGLVQIEQKINELNQQLSECEDKKTLFSQVNAEIQNNLFNISQLENNIQKRLEEMKSLSDSQDNIMSEIEQMDSLRTEREKLDENNQELLTSRSYYDAATILLKDTGIKTKIIKQYLPVINKLVNKYLSSLDFFVNFNLDESFKETIKSRHRDEFSYESFSEGEKQRIDMALMLTWRSVAKLKSSINTNLLILDEIFDSSLDANGTEELIRILHELENTNLFVISHKSDQLIEKFDCTLRFAKIKNFSRIQK